MGFPLLKTDTIIAADVVAYSTLSPGEKLITIPILKTKKGGGKIFPGISDILHFAPLYNK